MTLKQGFSDWLVPKLHGVSTLRAIAKQLLRGWPLQQPFHGGVICLDAVEHSWAWTGSRRYETFDRELQDKLLLLSQDYEMMLDIGSNIGAVTLSVALRNPNIKAICVDPNSRAIALLKKSIRINHLVDRVKTAEAAVADTDGVINFDESGSVTGHISDSGRQVVSIGFEHLLNEYSSSSKCLVKLEIEGFETKLLRTITDVDYLHNLCLVVELHPLQFNEVGNPNDCLNFLLASGAIIEDLQGQPLNQVENKNFTQIVAKWSYA